jgi:bis(5'-nucleosyl)-tetraphosphatase (symmetrical)
LLDDTDMSEMDFVMPDRGRPSQGVSSTYAIGDVQGCFDDLLRLLEKLEFDPNVDRLWFTGDLVNKGPNSLELLRFVRGLGSAAITVLGNHDLHLLAAAAGAVKIRKKDTIAEILYAPDCEELLFWLRHQPVLHHSETLGFTMIHAGLPPQWDLEKARQCARELETVLQNFDYEDLFLHLAGDGPLRWREDLEGWERLCFITNCFTQLRWCSHSGRIDLLGKRRTASAKKKRSRPWFEIPHRASKPLRILFGHWAKLVVAPPAIGAAGVVHLDTGCANGGRFTAFRLEDWRCFRLKCKNKAVPWRSLAMTDRNVPKEPCGAEQ